MQNTPSRLIILPYELHRLVLFFLGPLDILSLQRVCKQIHSLTNERNLWIQNLKEMCEQNAVFFPTYPIEVMTLQELKLSATRPERFLSFLENSRSGESLQSLEKRLFHFQRLIENTPDIYLVPGGRYLFSFCSSYVSLLDLSHFEPVMLAEIETICRSFVVSTTWDGLGLRVVVFGSTLENRSELNVFDIYPLSPNPEFINISTFSYPVTVYIRVVCVSGDLVVLAGHQTLWVWNFITQKATMWKVMGQVKRIFATETTVTTVSHNKIIRTWRIPELSFESSALFFKFGGAKTLHPDTEVDSSRDFLRNIGQVAGPCHWYTGMKMYPNHLFDLLGVFAYNDASVDETEEYTPELYRYQLNASNPCDTNLLVHKPYLVQKYCLEPTTDVDLEQVQPYRFINSRLARVWHEVVRPDSSSDYTRTKLHIGASGLFDSQVTGKQYSLFDEDPVILAPPSFTFCPISGRICYFPYLGRRDGVSVVDFVK
ncbi:hypothetical protein BDQ17DRAFT_1347136 [Cyathus striatus]|nr:hypothetical protein BDQ17DRAFT_1347136 [Cyathus striatus]